MKEKSINLFVQSASAGFIFLFAYTAIDKLSRLSRFSSALHDSPILAPSAWILVWAIPAAELAIVALLFFPKTRRAGFMSAFALMVIFTWYIIYSLATKTRMPCSCGGLIEILSWQQHVAFNITCSFIAAVAWLLTPASARTKWTSQNSLASGSGQRVRTR